MVAAGAGALLGGLLAVVPAQAATLTANNDAVTVVVNAGTSQVSVMANDTIIGPFGGTPRVASGSGTTAVGGSFACGFPNSSQCLYRPPAGYLGTDSFGYRLGIQSGSNPANVFPSSNTATVTLTMAPNHPPTAVADTATSHGTAQVGVDVLGNDTDPDRVPGHIGERLSVVVASGSSTAAGTYTCDSFGCTYRAASGFLGDDTFTYTMTDLNGAMSSSTVTVTVGPNAPPVANDDVTSILVNYAGGAVTRSIDVAQNDTDADGDFPRATGTGTTSHGGTYACGGDSSCAFTPAVGFFGTDTFTYVANDDAGGTSSATVSVTVGLDQPPTAGDDSATVRGSAPLEIPVFANDSDPEGQLVLASPADSLSVQGATVHCHQDSGDGIGPAGCRYQAPPGFAGTDTFTYTVGDASGVSFDPATVTVVVTPNRNPYTAPDVFDTRRDGNLSNLEVLRNDGDPEGDALSMPVQFLTSQGGASVVCAGPSCEYHLVPSLIGSIDSFTYTVEDGHGGSATGTMQLYLGLNAPPIAVDDAATTTPGTPVVVHVLANDCDPNCAYPAHLNTANVPPAAHGTVTCTEEYPGDPSGGRCTYAPNAGFEGTDTWGYTIDDFEGLTASATVSVTVSAGEAVATSSPPGGAVSSPGSASPTNPIVTTVGLAAAGGGVSIVEQTVASIPPTGYSLLGQEVVIHAPSGTAADPLRLTFAVDPSSAPAGTLASSVAVFRNGALVPDCSGPSGTASPDPCIAARSDGPPFTFTALTSATSTWSFGVRTPAWPFGGFYAPVDNAPVVNAAKAGSAIPVKFGLGAARGLGVLTAGSPSSVAVSCVSGAVLDEIETTVSAGASSLSYDTASGRYTYVWKTATSWAGSCRQLRLALADGTVHTALFKFR